ncbi:DUF2971 domain-containing protein [Neptuniibacter sp. QD48_11]|uniref:DUF2971 domain-containing protein n=1 Tax=Neptuniibacter sp. QD48_11 TaxID=3398211 RepID=UPI0039F5D3D9
MRLYKYLSSAHKLFTDGLIRVSQPSVLNDPYEAFFDRKAVEELLLEASYHGPEDMGWALEEIESTISKTGVISLTQSYDNLLMWAHYANEHRGLVVGFNVIDDCDFFVELFPRINEGSLSQCFGEGPIGSPVYNGQLDSIKYQKQPAFRLDTYEYPWDELSAGDTDLIARHSFLHKSDEWIYEKEHRYIIHLEQADVVKIPESTSESHDGGKLVRGCVGLLGDSAEYVYCYDGKAHEFNLYMIEDSPTRQLVAKLLSGLSHYSDVIYCMRINTGLISACILGESFDLSKQSKALDGIDNTNVFNRHGDFFKSKRSTFSYQLDFDNISRDDIVQ